MLRAISFLLIIGCMSAEDWHLASKAECDAETKLEYQEMAKGGWCCDPSITMGFAMFGHGRMIALSPCGYTNGKDFKPIYKLALFSKKKTREFEMTKEQYEGLWVATDDSKVLTYSSEHEDDLIKMALGGRLKEIFWGK